MVDTVWVFKGQHGLVGCICSSKYFQFENELVGNKAKENTDKEECATTSKQNNATVFFSKHVNYFCFPFKFVNGIVKISCD